MQGWELADSATNIQVYHALCIDYVCIPGIWDLRPMGPSPDTHRDCAPGLHWGLLSPRSLCSIAHPSSKPWNSLLSAICVTIYSLSLKRADHVHEDVKRIFSNSVIRRHLFNCLASSQNFTLDMEVVLQVNYLAVSYL